MFVELQLAFTGVCCCRGLAGNKGALTAIKEEVYMSERERERGRKRKKWKGETEKREKKEAGGEKRTFYILHVIAGEKYESCD